MQINPKALIDLPGAGNAEKELRKAGLWRLTDQEKLNQVAQSLKDAIQSIELDIDMLDAKEDK